MDSWNDSENTELTGEITEGYFSEGSGNVRDAPKKKHPKKKGRIQNPESDYTGYESRYGFSGAESIEEPEKLDNAMGRSFVADDFAAFTENDSRIFTPDSRKSFVESRKAESVGIDERSATENFSVSRTQSSNSKSSENKKKEYRKRLKAKAKEKRENQRKLVAEEARKNAESEVLNTCKSGKKETVAGYEGNGIFYADPDISEQTDTKVHSRPDHKKSDRKAIQNTKVNRADSTMKTEPVNGSDIRGKPDISESSGKRTSLALFGSDDTGLSDTGSHSRSRQVAGKVSGAGMKATDYSIRKVSSAISKATGEKDDNAGADAMRLAEQGGETVSRYGFYVAKDITDSAFEESTKTVKKVSDYTTDSIFDTAKKELTREEKKKLAYRRALKKKRRQAYRKAKKAAKETGKKTYEGTKETAKVVKAVVRRVVSAVFALPKALLIILLLLIVLLLIGGEIAGSTVSLVTEAASIMSAATYQSSPQMIDQADLEFSYMELMLRDQIDEIEDDYPDYDEYSYTLGSIGHDPFTLINYLHAEYGTINSDAMASLEGLFNAMYQLKLTPTEETRYRLVPKPPEEDEEDDSGDEDDDSEDEDDEEDEEDEGDESGDDEEDEDDDEEPEYILEEYTVSILKVELISRSMESVVEERLAGNATGKAIYAVLNKTHGLVQYIASPTFDTWSVESYYGYRRNPYGDYPELHRGLDIAMPVGTSVHSAISGTVKEIGSDPMFGDYIVVEDERGYTVKYASMGHISAIPESIVHQGETLGYSGSNGSEPPSLHMEFLVNGTYYNPLFYTANIQPETD